VLLPVSPVPCCQERLMGWFASTLVPAQGNCSAYPGVALPSAVIGGWQLPRSAGCVRLYCEDGRRTARWSVDAHKRRHAATV
jgi:hypothetical protein